MSFRTGVALRFAAAAAVGGVSSTTWGQADPAIAHVADLGRSKGKYRNDLMVANADGTHGAAVWTRSHAESASLLRHPAWSPDADGNSANGYRGVIAVSGSDPARGLDPGGSWYSVLWLIDVSAPGGVPQGTGVRVLVAGDLDPLAGAAFSPEWSPDLDGAAAGYQGRILYWGSAGLAVIDVAWTGATIEPVNGPNSSSFLASGAPIQGPYSTWSPDGSRIAVNGLGDSIVILDAATGAVSATLAGLPGDPTDLCWSRTGSRLAFRATPPGNQQLYSVDADLGPASVRQVTFEPCGTRYPSWSPDDGSVIYTRFFCGGGQGYTTIRRVHPSTGATTTLLSQPKANLWYPDWRPF